MAANWGGKAERPPTAGSVSYPGVQDPLQVPRTPLESRQGYHPKAEDRLIWKSPPSRQLTRQRRVEYESDVRERFYDDYLGSRTTGDAKNEVLTTTELAKLKFNPDYYRVNAYQGLAYDPMRQVPAGLDFNVMVQQERTKERQRQSAEHRQRRMSDSSIGYRGAEYYSDQQYHQQPQPSQYTRQGPVTLPPLKERPRSALQQSMDEVVSPEIVPAVEDWLINANKKDQDIAAGFFRTLSSHGQRPDPATKATVHRTRVRSAVMTPSRKLRQEQKTTQDTFQQLSRDVSSMDKHAKTSKKSEPSYRQHPLKRSNSEKATTTKGSMFTAKKQLPSHFTIHPDWASESTSQHKRK